MAHVYGNSQLMLELRVDTLLDIIKQKDSALDSLNADCYSRDERIAILEKSLTAKENTIVQLSKELSLATHSSTIIESLQKTIEAKEQEFWHKEQKVLDLKNQMKET